MNLKSIGRLAFNAQFNPAKDKKLCQGLSAAERVGDTLWIANDETITLERLTICEADGTKSPAEQICDGHKQYRLDEFFPLPAPPESDGKFEEADIEGLAHSGGYLWLIGSHSLKRKKPVSGKEDKKNLENLCDVSSDGNRFLLARIPITEKDGTFELEKSAKDGRVAARLRGNRNGNDLTKELREDEHLKHFLSIPGKDNGFDIEGLAVDGDRILIGLRGPVLRGWAVILELVVKEAEEDGELMLRLDSLKKRFIQLGGLGIRDLLIHGSDLLILAGPTMDLDGPVAIYRWRDALSDGAKRLLFHDDEALEWLADIPFGRGDDHAEGMTVFSQKEDGTPESIMIVYDAVSAKRQVNPDGMIADIFTL